MESFPHFLFRPGIWKGTGTVSLSMSPEVINFNTEWNITQNSEKSFIARQRIELDTGDIRSNVFLVHTYEEKGIFQIVLENEVAQSQKTIGNYDSNAISWKFNTEELNGIEVYERHFVMPYEEKYHFHAQYDGGEGFQTTIRGVLVQI